MSEEFLMGRFNLGWILILYIAASWKYVVLKKSNTFYLYTTNVPRHLRTNVFNYVQVLVFTINLLNKNKNSPILVLLSN